MLALCPQRTLRAAIKYALVIEMECALHTITLIIPATMKLYLKENCRGISRDIRPRAQEYISL